MAAQSLQTRPIDLQIRQMNFPPGQSAIELGSADPWRESHAIIRVDRQKPQIKEPMQIAAQEQAVLRMMRMRAPISGDMRRLQNIDHVASADAASAAIGLMAASLKRPSMKRRRP